MKKVILVMLAMGTLAYARAQQGVIVKQSGGESAFIYTSTFLGSDLSAAIAQCNPLGGDTLILPGGTPFNLIGTNNSLVIDRPIVIIGAGYLASSNTVTNTTAIIGSNNIVLMNGAEGTSIHGIDFRLGGGMVNFTNDGTQNVSFFRCTLPEVRLGDTGPGMMNSQIHFQECLLGGLRGYDATSVTVDNCILMTSPQAFTTGGLTMRNSVVHGWNMSAGPGNMYHNNVLMRNANGGAINEASCFNDCVFVCVSGVMTQGVATCITNCTSSGLAGVFNSVTSITAYDQLNDYGIPTTSPAFPRQADIYQGPAPWKVGAVPFNPHWMGLSVPGTTNGGLIQNVIIQGKSQSH